MYSAVSTRRGEIAVLRAVGFGPGGVVTSVLFEALLLSMAGACLGAVIAWALFNGASISTISGATPSQITFPIQVTLPIVVLGIAGACAIGMIGGAFPAVHAGRATLANALRQD